MQFKAVSKSHGEKVLGLGFIAAFTATGSVDGSDGVTLGGRAMCFYKKKR